MPKFSPKTLVVSNRTDENVDMEKVKQAIAARLGQEAEIDFDVMNVPTRYIDESISYIYCKTIEDRKWPRFLELMNDVQKSLPPYKFFDHDDWRMCSLPLEFTK